MFCFCNLLNKNLTYSVLAILLLVLARAWFHDNGIRKLSRIQAVNEIDLFYELIESKSSYLQLSSYSVDSAILNLKGKINEEEYISNMKLARGLGLILSEIKDRHASVSVPGQEYQEHYLPFAIAPWQDEKVIALQEQDEDQYDLFLINYPVLQSIEGIKTSFWIDLANYENKHAPRYAKHAEGVAHLAHFGKIALLQSININKKLSFTFSDFNRQRDTTLYMRLSNERKHWNDCGGQSDLTKELFTKKITITYSSNSPTILLTYLYQR